MPTKTLTQSQKALYIVNFEKLKTSKAWLLTSELVRRLGKGRCYTCGAFVPFEKSVAGHAIEKRGHAAIYFDLDCLRNQCSRCNRRLHGNHSVFAAKLIEEIGPERFKKMHQRAIKSMVYTKLDLDKIAEERSEMISKLPQRD